MIAHLSDLEGSKRKRRNWKKSSLLSAAFAGCECKYFSHFPALLEINREMKTPNKMRTEENKNLNVGDRILDLFILFIFLLLIFSIAMEFNHACLLPLLLIKGDFFHIPFLLLLLIRRINMHHIMASLYSLLLLLSHSQLFPLKRIF